MLKEPHPLRRFAHRGRYLWTYIAPATILPDERFDDLPSLREEASHEGLCYIRVLRLLEDGVYHAQVAPSQETLASEPITVLLTEEQLYAVLPVDCRIQGKSSKIIAAMLRAHAAQVRPPSVVQPPVVQPSTIPAPSFGEKPAYIDVPSEVIEGTLDNAAAHASALIEEKSSGAWQKVTYHLIKAFRMQQALLQAIVNMLLLRLSEETSRARQAFLHERCLLIHRLRCWQKQSRQRVVSAKPIYDKQKGQLLWRLTIDISQAVA